MLYFLLSTLVLTLYIDVVLSLSIKTCGCIGGQVIFIPTLERYMVSPCVVPFPLKTCPGRPKTPPKSIVVYERCFQNQGTTTAIALLHVRKIVINLRQNQQSGHTMPFAWPFGEHTSVFHEWIHSQNDTPGEMAWKLKQIENVDLLTRNFLQVILSVMLDRVNMIFNPVQFHVRINDTLFI